MGLDIRYFTYQELTVSKNDNGLEAPPVTSMTATSIRCDSNRRGRSPVR